MRNSFSRRFSGMYPGREDFAFTPIELLGGLAVIATLAGYVVPLALAR